MATQEVFHAGIQAEAQEDLPRVAQHHDERHQRTPRAADLQVAEAAPIDLSLFAGKGAQAQIGLGLGARPMAGDEVAEVIGAAGIATLAHHGVEAAGRQPGECRERLGDERQIGIDLRGPRRRPDPGQPSLCEHALHHARGGCATARRWCRLATSRRGGSAGSAPRCQAASPWRLNPVRSCATRPR